LLIRRAKFFCASRLNTPEVGKMDQGVFRPLAPMSPRYDYFARL
jgi:hypothetical protein